MNVKVSILIIIVMLKVENSSNGVCRIVEDEILVSLLLSFRTDEDELLFVAAQIE